MSYDPYADCPCGSGKKIKFCCQDVIPEMQKVARLRENQPTRAAQILEGLEKDFGANLWVASSHARLLMEQGEYSAAKRRCERYLARDGNDEQNPELNAIVALAAFVSDGYESAKRAVHRAFQLSARREPALVTRLAGAISLVMLEAESFMSARAHAAIAVKLSPEDRRSHCVMQLAQIEGSSRIPYPLRSVHRLVDYTAAVEDQKELDRAVRLSSLGCWKPASILLKRLTDKHPDAAELWHNLALCHAWDGNEPAAAEAFHKAASLYKDDEAAVECETLAQLLDLELTEDVNEIVLKSYKIDSVSRLLTSLDKEDLFDRLSIEVPLDGEGPVAQYRLLAKPFPTDKKPEQLTPEDIPEFIADVLVFDATDQRSAQLQITGVEGEGFEQADKTLNKAVSDQITLDKDADDEPLGVVPVELEGLEWNCHFPADFPATIARNIETQKMQAVATDVWPNLKLSGLGGKTPLEAKDDSKLQVALKSSIHVLDAFYDRNNVMLDIETLRGSLGLEAPAPVVPGENNVTGFSTMALQRIKFGDLSDDQLVDIARRVLLVRHTRTAYDALTEVAGRQVCVDRIGAERVFSTLVGICREQNRRDEALKWLTAGRDAAEAADEAFRNILEWDVRELNLRMDDPTDSGIPGLWKKFEEQYFPKLPEIRESMVMFMIEKGLGHLVSEVATVTAGGGEIVWTPDSDDGDADGAGDKKLWVPGQE
jgi:tetratricopeptide (TPR) repeat protein